MAAFEYELAFENIDEFRTFMRMERKLRTGLESDNLHLQAIGYGHVLHKHSGRDGRWLPR
jgi:hypothetical protein